MLVCCVLDRIIIGLPYVHANTLENTGTSLHGINRIPFTRIIFYPYWAAWPHSRWDGIVWKRYVSIRKIPDVSGIFRILETLIQGCVDTDITAIVILLGLWISEVINPFLDCSPAMWRHNTLHKALIGVRARYLIQRFLCITFVYLTVHASVQLVRSTCCCARIVISIQFNDIVNNQSLVRRARSLMLSGNQSASFRVID